MTPKKLQQIKDLFAAALEVPTGDRVTFVAQACADDSDLRREVESLLSFEAQAEGFIEKPFRVTAALVGIASSGAKRSCATQRM